MSTKIFPRTATKNAMYMQAYVLLILGIVCLLSALLILPSTNEYPVGVMIFGLGMLIACLVNPHRLVIASFLTSALGIALMARRGYVGAGALTPGIFVLGVGIIEYWLINGYSIGSLTLERFITFMLSFWLPGISLTMLGFTYLLMSTGK